MRGGQPALNHSFAPAFPPENYFFGENAGAEKGNVQPFALSPRLYYETWCHFLRR